MNQFWWRSGMNTSVLEAQSLMAERVSVNEESLVAELSDGRVLSVPLAWYPRLLHGTKAERNNWRLVGRGEGIHWPDLDEDISVSGLLCGTKSGESQSSFAKWIQTREKAGSARKRGRTHLSSTGYAVSSASKGVRRVAEKGAKYG
jgi:hypothetical protein